MHLTNSWKRGIVGACAAVLVLPLTLAAGTAGAATPAVPATIAKAAPATSTFGASVIGIPNIVGNRLNVSIQSPAMGRAVPIQVLLPPGYNLFDPNTTYPELYQLDGLRAPTTTTDWTNQADTQSFFADKRVLVVQTIGGAGSFFQDWRNNDPGLLANNKETGNLKWETFLTTELPGIVGTYFHGNGNRAISGLSMGGFSAFDIAAKHPTLYKAAASYSGYLNSQALGLPEFLQYVLTAQSMASDAANMWGPPSDPAWTANNPTAQIQKLKGLSLYISAGTGGNGPYDKALGSFGLSAEYVGAILEVIANYSSQSFYQTALASGVPVQTADLSNPGVHSWGYWSVQYRKSWPQLAAAIGANVTCEVGGAINVAWQQLGAGLANIGRCTGPEAQAPGQPAGVRVQPFSNGDFYYSAATGAHGVQGAINGKYQGLGGSASFLGLPLTNELPTPNGLGLFNQFQNGYIYYTVAHGAHEVHGAILANWAQQGYETSRFGFPVSDEYDSNGFRRTDFEHGSILFKDGVFSYL